MKNAINILLVTGACALGTALLARLWGLREDFGSAIGGLAGFVLANGTAFALPGSKAKREWNHENFPASQPFEERMIYVVFAITYFSLIGWLTGFIHQHGEFAGAVSGSLGGYMLAVIVPAIHGESFMSEGRKLQLASAVVTFVVMLGIIWVMYEHEIR